MENYFFKKSVKDIFEKFPLDIQESFMKIRDLIFEVAACSQEIGELTEDVRWGQISYLTLATKSGSLIRIDVYGSLKNKLALFFHCQTTLISEFRQQFPNTFEYESNRALIVDVRNGYDQQALRTCIQRALTYKLNSKKFK